MSRSTGRTPQLQRLPDARRPLSLAQLFDDILLLTDGHVVYQ